MGFRGDERAQSVQLGAIILFGFIIIGISTYQTTVIPNQNSEIEFEQSQAIREDMSELRNQLQSTGVTGESQPVELQLGTRFPPRTLFVNPPPMTGTIQTENLTRANITLVSGSVRGAVTDDASEYWRSGQDFEAKLLIYRGDYRQYGSAPENVSVQLGHVVASYQNGNTVNVTDRPNLVSNDRVTIVLVQGNLSENSVGSVTVNPRSVSEITRRETIEGTINITLPTTLPASKVRGLLEDTNQITVESVSSVGNNAVRIQLNGTIRLGIAAVGVGSGNTPRKPAYIDVEQRENTSVGSESEVVIEVRDQFGNPYSGQQVNLSLNNTNIATLAQSKVTTDADGRATVTITGKSPGDVKLNASFVTNQTTGAFKPDEPGNTTVRISVAPPSGLGGAENNTSLINPTDVILTQQVYENNIVKITLKNNGDQNVTLSEARLSFYLRSGDDQGPTQANFTTPSSDSAILQIGGSFKSFKSVKIPKGEERSFCFAFQDRNGNPVSFATGDFFVSETRFSSGEDAQYFVNPAEVNSISCPNDNAGGGGDPVPGNGVAFDDANGNGQYDTGETKFTVSDLENGIANNIDLIIAEEVTNAGQIDLSNLNSLRIDKDILAKKLKFTATNGVVVAPGVSLETTSDEIRLTSEQGSVIASDALLISEKKVTIKADNGRIEAAGVSIDAQGQVKIGEGNSGQIVLNGASITASGDVSIKNDDQILARNAIIDVSGGSDRKIELVAKGDIDVTNARLVGDAGSDFSANIGPGKYNFFVQDAEFEQPDGTGKEIDLQPNNKQSGTPENGEVV